MADIKVGPSISVVEAQSGTLDRSDARLEALGYRPEFREFTVPNTNPAPQREMNLFAVVGISFTAIGILTGMSSAFQTGLFSSDIFKNSIQKDLFRISDDGRSVLLGVQVSANRHLRILIDFTEIVIPNHRMKADRPVLGYVTGILYACAMIFSGTSGNLSTALYIASMAEVGTGVTLTRVQIAAVAWGVNLLSAIINTFGSRGIGTVAQINGTVSRLQDLVGQKLMLVSVWWTLIGTLILVVTLLVKSPAKNSASFVFTDLENFTGWENKGFVVLLGFLQAVYTLEGAEASAQVAEEARNAEWLAPIGIAASIVGSWLIGLVYLLALLFSIQSIPSIQSTSFAIPIAQLYYDAVGKRLTLLCLFVVGSCQFMAACTCFTASSRLLYALARDNAIPGKKAFTTLNRFQAPWVGVWLSAAIAIVISAAYIGSVVAFNAILSSAAIAVMLSYLQPILCRVLWPESMGARGPFHLGKYSRGINLISALFTTFVCVLVSPPWRSLSSTERLVTVYISHFHAGQRPQRT
ncbi:hypothetical protein FRC10_002306 [Ceratobasidium sp. 414]|nr:hypothetical protein FRC10_002306 [Ceratobasidium sp. 414]